MATKKLKAPHRTYDIALTGELDGFRLTIGAMTGRDIIALRRGDVTDVDVIDLVASRVESHNFDVDDIRDLDFWIVAAILSAWNGAISEEALPNANATS